MTVKELKDLVSGLSDNTEVVFKPQNSSYVEDFTGITGKAKEVHAFWGKNYKAFVIYGEQTGGIE